MSPGRGAEAIYHDGYAKPPDNSHSGMPDDSGIFLVDNDGAGSTEY